MLGELLEFRLPQIQAVFFDFDGVIVDSVSLKTRAYQDLFHPYGDQAVQIITEYHAAHGGIDRYRKIKYTLDQLEVDSAAEIVDDLAAKFASLVKDAVIERPLMSGMLEILKSIQEAGVPAFVVSGTPERELQEIVTAKKLDAYFLEVLGSPATKEEILARLLNQYKFDGRRTLFLGDAQTDFKAAQSIRAIFIGIPEAD